MFTLSYFFSCFILPLYKNLFLSYLYFICHFNFFDFSRSPAFFNSSIKAILYRRKVIPQIAKIYIGYFYFLVFLLFSLNIILYFFLKLHMFLDFHIFLNENSLFNIVFNFLSHIIFNPLSHVIFNLLPYVIF